MRRLVLFDIDGTLVNTRGAGRAALVSAMEAVYGEAGPVDTFDFHGMTDPAIVRGLLRAVGHGDAGIVRGFDRLWELYYLELDRELATRDGSVFPYAGVRTLLDTVAEDRRFLQGLVTGNMEQGAWKKLEACGLAGHFTFGAFGSDSEVREDLPPLACRRAESGSGARFRLEEAVVVGDTPADIRCARSAGARSLAVATGRHSLRELEEHRPDRAVADLSDTEFIIRILADE